MAERLAALESSEHVALSTTMSENPATSNHRCKRLQQQLRTLADRVRSLCGRIDTLLLQRSPWLNWAFVYAVGMLYAFTVRCVTMPSLIETFGAKDDDRFSVKLAGLALGCFEDFVWLNYLLVLLWGVDACCALCLKDFRLNGLLDCFDAELAATTRASLVARRLARFVAFLALFVAFAASIAADSVLMRTRSMRFTFEFVEMYFNDKSAAGSLEVSKEDLAIAHDMIGATAAVGVAFAVTATIWIDLTLWSPLQLFAKPSSSSSRSTNSDKQKCFEDSPMYVMMEQSGNAEASRANEPSSVRGVQRSTSHHALRKDSVADLESQHSTHGHCDTSTSTSTLAIVKAVVLILFALVALPEIGLAVSCASAAVVAHVALNTSLNEPFRIWFSREFLPGLSSGSFGSISSSNLYVHSDTESYAAFGESVLYRRTLGFKGDLAFDVQVDQADLPNVLVIAVESFRYHDSQYLVGNSTYLLKNQNITVTPNFDRWAKRGIAFRNFWSSWRTSRSIESILFGQLPYDSLTDSGTTGGRKGVELSGMPQLFKAKGYEAVFTTGCRTDYDQWDRFLPAHGFDSVLAMDEIKELAEKDLGISSKDWAQQVRGGQGRAMSYWGVHDDVSFEVLGNILANKIREQQQRRKNNEPKKPFFLNHYTISSHTPFRDRPSWFVNYTKMPDFRALYAGEAWTDAVKNYLEMRYFTDMALGKFLDRMHEQGVLNDTIVVITGDHGQAPERGFDMPETRQISATRVGAAMIAEGRLGKYAGTVFEDAAEQYDLLNTLADIVGVPDGGFIQSGVGRSLKRKIPFGERVVWSNNPSQKLAAVRGHERLQFDRLSSDMSLFDADADHDQTHDLFPALDAAQKQEAKRLRDAGRWLNQYFKRRWDRKCILSVDC